MPCHTPAARPLVSRSLIIYYFTRICRGQPVRRRGLSAIRWPHSISSHAAVPNEDCAQTISDNSKQQQSPIGRNAFGTGWPPFLILPASDTQEFQGAASRLPLSACAPTAFPRPAILVARADPHHRITLHESRRTAKHFVPSTIRLLCFARLCLFAESLNQQARGTLDIIRL